MEFLVLIAVMIAMFWFMSRSARKQRERLVEKQKSAAVPGTWVVTIGGFLGQVVSVDGDVVTLESPSGVETIWQVAAIREAHVPNFGSAEEDDEFADGADSGSHSAGFARDADAVDDIRDDIRDDARDAGELGEPGLPDARR